MRKVVFIAAAGLCACALSGEIDAAETSKGVPAPAKAAPKKARKEMTKEDFVDSITKRLNRTKQIAGFIPGLVAEKDSSGNASYAYNGKKLENMDRDGLENLYVAVQQTAMRINTERINRQLENIRQAGRAAQAARQIPQPPREPPRPPPQPPREPPRPPPQPPRR